MWHLVLMAVIAAAPLAQARAFEYPQPPQPEPRAYGFAYGYGTEHSSYLGIDPQDITSDRVAELKLKSETGVEVGMVDQDSPAGKAGIKEHDVILQFNGAPVESVEELKRMLRETPPGRTIALGLSRDGQSLSINVKLGDRSNAMFHEIPMAPVVPMPAPAITAVVPDMDFDIPSIEVHTYNRRYGLQLENLTPQLGEFFGVKNGNGVLVRSVEHGSAGERAGFKAGDVIIKMGDQKITSSTDWRMATRSRRAAGKVPVTVVRDHREVPLTLTLPASNSRDESEWLGPDFEKSMQEFEGNNVRLQLENLRQKLASRKMQQEIAQGVANAQRALQEQMEQLRWQLQDWE